MKAYHIGDYHVAAHNETQALGTLAAHLGEDAAEVLKDHGPAKEVNPEQVEVNFENDNGGFDKGTLAEIMPNGDDPEGRRGATGRRRREAQRIANEEEPIL